MKSTKSESIPIEELRSVLNYNKETGILSWSKKVAKKVIIGRPIGCRRPDGYLSIRYKGCMILVHRLVMALSNGRWPPHEVDHINGKKDDNRFINLREATIPQNRRNSKIRSTNTHGTPGVTFHPKREPKPWMARIADEYLGSFATKEEAIEVRLKREIEKYGEFSFYRRPDGE